MEKHFLGCFLLLNFIQSGLSYSPSSRAVCLYEVDEGPCDDYEPRYYYNKLSQKCEQFNFGGCKGNENNFKSFESCHKTCYSIPKIPRICRLPKNEGLCFGISRRYFFNMTSMECEEFSYGGCHGNNNNFQDRISCMEYCSPPKSVPVICLGGFNKGTGTASILRYYFDSTKKTCKSFEYTGSGGNNNNFVSMASCRMVCMKKRKQNAKEQTIRVLKRRL